MGEPNASCLRQDVHGPDRALDLANGRLGIGNLDDERGKAFIMKINRDRFLRVVDVPEDRPADDGKSLR